MFASWYPQKHTNFCNVVTMATYLDREIKHGHGQEKYYLVLIIIIIIIIII